MKGDEISKKLSAAARLLSKPNAWGKGTWARDAAGDAVLPSDSRACRFCLGGAVIRSFGGRSYSDVPASAWRRVTAALHKLHGVEDFANFNDHTTKKQVVAVLRKAATL